MKTPVPNALKRAIVEAMGGWGPFSVREIENLFLSHDFFDRREGVQEQGVRRTAAAEFLEEIDWANPEQRQSLLNLIDDVLDHYPEESDEAGSPGRVLRKVLQRTMLQGQPVVAHTPATVGETPPRPAAHVTSAPAAAPSATPAVAAPQAESGDDSSHPHAFITWAHSGEDWDAAQATEWRDRVVTFANTLRASGIDADMDLFHASERGIDWNQFGPRRIEEAEWVLAVVSKAWYERWSGRNTPTVGAGAASEARTLQGLFARDQNDIRRRLVVVILEGVDRREAVPPEIEGHHRFVVNEAGTGDGFEALVRLLTGQPEHTPAPLGTIPALAPKREQAVPTRALPTPPAADADEPVRLVGIDQDAIDHPSNDGTRGSALYAVRIRLSRTPSAEWSRLFPQVWDRPPQFTTMHRPGIARVSGDRIVLDGTTVEEVGQYHRDTLRLVVERVNELVAAAEAKHRAQAVAREESRRAHEENVRQRAAEIDF